MIAINAGHTLGITNIRDYLAVCKREPNDLAYYVPVQDLSDVQVYLQLTSRPIFVNVYLYDLCTDTHVQITYDRFVIGKDPDDRWYGLYTFPASIPVPRLFAIAFLVRRSGFGIINLHYSQAYEKVDCGKLMKLEACFPTSRQDEHGYDLTGIYYGAPRDVAGVTGDRTLTYKHKLYLRRAKLHQEPPKLTFTANTRRNFRTKVERPYELRSETVPDWYKEYVLAIYSRGFIQVNGGQMYRVTDVAFEGVNENDRTWKPYAKLMLEKDFQFGCEGCEPLPQPCESDVAAGGHQYMDGVFTYDFTGTLPAGATLFWEIRNPPSFFDLGILVDSGQIASTPLQLQSSYGIDTNTNCYSLRFRIGCANGEFTAWQAVEFGNCDTPPPEPNTTQVCAGATEAEACACGEQRTVYYTGTLGSGTTLYTDAAMTVVLVSAFAAIGGTIYAVSGGSLTAQGPCVNDPVCRAYQVQGYNQAGFVEWEDCATGSFYSSFLGNSVLTVCSRNPPSGESITVSDSGSC